MQVKLVGSGRTLLDAKVMVFGSDCFAILAKLRTREILLVTIGRNTDEGIT